MQEYEEARRILKEHAQENVLQELEKNKRKELIEQVLHLDFEKIQICKEKIEEREKFQNDKIEHISYVDSNELTKGEKEEYEQLGNSIIKQGKYAVVTMAGGQRNKVRPQSDQKEPLGWR